MNLFNILSDLEGVNAEASERFLFSRRKLLRTTSVAALATPAFFAATVNKAFAADADVVEVLNFALMLEYLEAEFYKKGTMMSNLIPQSDKQVFMKIAEHEKQHVEFLKSQLGDKAKPMPEFDFTAKGMFPDPFTNYPIFLTLSQSFEDLGVRAYKGQAPKLKDDKAVLLAALKIHSVEARHAAEIRLVRQLRVWASEQETGGVPAVVYKGENNIRHHDAIDLVSLSDSHLYQMSGSDVEMVVRESFDEPLTKEEVLSIAGPFIKTMMP
ncbi:ferritin-like domain-containing protein [Larkinella terrae]|uniref:Ferritin-like domain-containing protein n=1 Tax=Larkinella terrae TaxID=2025311 RepID=A0A7K0EDK2_9BACT|nr:ferritin-like domain-containing protein [Larkinella terrae]MRS59691.1 ferritin-like domain-containing protein [Larkinella terrae]